MAFFPLSTTSQQVNGEPLAGGMLWFYDAQSTDPRPVYTTAALDVEHDRPVRINGLGRVPVIHVGYGDYKVVITTAGGSEVDVIDDLPGQPYPVDNGGGSGPSFTLPTGFVVPAYDTGPVSGWVRANGQTIGSENSDATEGAGPEMAALYVKLWTVMPELEVIGGRGPGASEDFQAGKSLTLPDARGAALVGLAGMGAGLPTDRLTTLNTPTPDILGTFVGYEAVALGVGNLPAHDHGVTVEIQPAGAHTPTGAIGSGGSHTHGFTYSVPGGANSNQGASNPGASGYTGVHPQTDEAGTHGHTLTMDAVPNHNHTVTATSASVGGDAVHTNMQPSVLLTIYIKT